MTDQLKKLAQPFPASMIQKAPKGNAAYVNHAIVNQRLLEILGPFSFSIDREIYDDGLLTGAVCTLSLEIDGQLVFIQEVGDCDSDTVKATGEYVTKGSGARLKNASSDAFKRCAMRAGVGLHLWSKDNYFLFDKLKSGVGGTRATVPLPTPVSGEVGLAQSSTSSLTNSGESNA